MAAVRESALSDIGLVYPLLRIMLREPGHRFVRAGSIAQSDDIFWLEADELIQSIADLERGESLNNLSGRVAQQ